MAIGKRTWRPVPVDCWDWLEDLSPLAQRLWFWLWTGPTSTPHGIVTVRAYHAAGALGTKPSTLLAALAELEQAGRIVSKRASDSRVDLYLVGYLIAQCRIKGAQRQAIKRAIEAVDLGLPTMQAIEDWEIWDSACAEDDASHTSGKRQPKPQQEQDHKQEQKQDKVSLPIGRHVPAAADTDRPTVGQTGQIAATQQQAPQAALLPLDDHTPAQAQKRQPQGQDGGKTAKRPRTVAEQKPTAEQTRAYFASQNAPASEADACLDYWQAQGFRRKAGPILDWEATCRTWIRNWRERGSQTQGRYGKPAPRVAPVDDRTPEEVAANQARITAEIERYEREGRSYF